MKKWLSVFFIFLLTIPLVFAADINLLLEDEAPTVKVVWQGETPIQDAISTKSVSTASILKAETDKIMKEQTYPYLIASGKTLLIIKKYKCDDKMGICGYWIEATRDGKEIYTNSPIWISPPPYQVVVSESFDEKTNEITTTLNEDPKAAVEATLQRYVEMQPLGKAVSYER